jgi:dolichyl-phosphate-mannose-protein mannosyltransferase
MWNIEKHINDKLPPAGAQSFKSSFIHDFVDLNVAMWASNNALTPDTDKQDDLVSLPYQWPLLLVGLRMCGWGDSSIKYFLLGTPVVWWGSTLSLIVLGVTVVVHMIRYRRGYQDFASLSASNDFYFAAKVGILGWVLHYLPFWIMGRVTYLHHYFPALYFAIIASAVLLDHLTRSVTLKSKWIFFGVLGVVVVANFAYFIDFAWGMPGPAEGYKARHWVSSWRLYGDE